MQRFRVGLVMLLAAGLLMVAGGRAQAVIGIPDDVPGATLLYPFFKVDPRPTALSRQDSLIVVTNTSTLNSSAPLFVHLTFWTADSVHVYDYTVALTPHDVFSCSLLDLFINPNQIARPCGTFQAPLGVAAALTDTATGLLVGYVTADTVTQPTSLFPGQQGYPFEDFNVLIGHLYLVNLPAGSSTGFNAVSIESILFPNGVTLRGTTGAGQPAVPIFPPVQVGFYLNRCIEEQGAANCLPFVPTSGVLYGNRERIDGFSGDVVQTIDQAGFPPANTFGDSPLSLLLRYFSLDELNGKSEVWLWKDRVTSGAAAAVAVYDEDENVHSIGFGLVHEVNFAETTEIITPGAPGGWFRVKFTCGPFNYCGYDPTTPDPTTAGATGALTTPIQAVAYSEQFANSLGSGSEQSRFLRWDAAFPAHRQYTNYINAGE